MPETTPRLLLPVKSLKAGKTRLAAAIGDGARWRLNILFLRHMAEVAAGFPGRTMTTVISGAEDTLAVAASLGLDTIRQRDDTGLNPAVAQGCTELYARGAQAILILPIDLPQVVPADLREVATLGKRSPAVICPDRHLSGTNAIFLAEPAQFRFQFGVDSYRRHGLAATERGLTPLLHFNARIALDVDTPDDLAGLEGTPFAPAAMANSCGAVRNELDTSARGRAGNHRPKVKFHIDR